MAKPTDDLRDCLAGLERILSYAGLYGGNEIATARDLNARITRLLAPEPAEPLIADARAFVARFEPFIEARKQQASRQEVVQQNAEAARAKAHAAHRAKQAAVAEAERKRVKEMIERDAKAAVAEVMG